MKIKFKRVNGSLIVSRDGEQKVLPTLKDVWEYIFHQRFIAYVNGEPISNHNDTIYPVDSLIPPTVEKTVKFYDLDAQGGVLLI